MQTFDVGSAPQRFVLELREQLQFLAGCWCTERFTQGFQALEPCAKRSHKNLHRCRANGTRHLRGNSI
jgi:hypothetical protein